MFLIEHVTRLIEKKHKKKYPKALIEFGFWERLVGILCWPVLLVVFIYNFFKQYFI